MYNGELAFTPYLSVISVSNLLLIAIPLICFSGAWLSTVAGMGGGILILGFCTQILPLPAVVPLSSVFVLAGQVARVAQFHRHIAWDITRPFIPGSMIGAVLGSVLYLSLSDVAIALLLGTVMLWFCWMPSTPASRNLAAFIPLPYFWVGIVHTFLSSLAGVGGLFQSMMVNSRLGREVIVATIAGTLLFMSVFKTISYVAGGFDYMPYLPVIILSWVAGTVGTTLGK
ncbi:MAG: sulfite exporter TauE/SafE family protein, partial [Pseudohongiellaceae bacterium]